MYIDPHSVKGNNLSCNTLYIPSFSRISPYINHQFIVHHAVYTIILSYFDLHKPSVYCEPRYIYKPSFPRTSSYTTISSSCTTLYTPSFSRTSSYINHHFIVHHAVYTIILSYFDLHKPSVYREPRYINHHSLVLRHTQPSVHRAPRCIHHHSLVLRPT